MNAEPRYDRTGVLILATSVAECPGCQQQRIHTEEELVTHHPWAGHGKNGAQPCNCGNRECKYAPKVN
jgi:hypothetical protein